ncbi:Uncharacterised protein [Vibrio cholerae]|nr:Uncharacterised protein [Vibrio cholerae]CSB87448.1 Uncharacterised protein [Vibrio cholerae]
MVLGMERKAMGTGSCKMCISWLRKWISAPSPRGEIARIFIQNPSWKKYCRSSADILGISTSKNLSV